MHAGGGGICWVGVGGGGCFEAEADGLGAARDGGPVEKFVGWVGGVVGGGGGGIGTSAFGRGWGSHRLGACWVWIFLEKEIWQVKRQLKQLGWTKSLIEVLKKSPRVVEEVNGAQEGRKIKDGDKKRLV